MKAEWSNALCGGVLIGISVSLMLLWNGRVTGISGILFESLRYYRGETSWRLSFLLGLLCGGLVLKLLVPQAFSGALLSANWTVFTAGLLVGFGTVLGSGCTSGHGICGVSRLSPRSLLATVLFIGSGVLAVALFRAMGILP